MIADEFPRPPNVLLCHANIIRFERCIEYDFAFLTIVDDMDMWLMPALIARIDDDAKATLTYTE